MSDYEEDLDDFPAENKEKPAESMVGAYRAESTDHYTAGSGITPKIPPLFDGSTSSFKYEDLFDDSLDLTVLEAEKRGQASWEVDINVSKNRSPTVGIAPLCLCAAGPCLLVLLYAKLWKTADSPAYHSSLPMMSCHSDH